MAHDQYNQALRGDMLRRPHGPAIDYAAEMENIMPLRQERVLNFDKASRRESKLGLRNIFGRSRPSKEGHNFNITPTSPTAPGFTIPKTKTMQPTPVYQYETISAEYSWKPLPATMEIPESEASQQNRQESIAPGKTPSSLRPGKHPASTPANWSLPPLFKAFPQSIRHATLPATSMSADAILRMNEKKTAREEDEGAIAFPNGAEERFMGARDKIKKKNRKNSNAATTSFEWTTKTYILVTSGYLLQYSGEGNFDRLPEKILKLGSSSAAFVADAIPGRHWVVQISAVAEGRHGAQEAESRSIFSKLSLKFSERRSVPNMLMVFESAQDMEGWITALRSEIERQGGRKKTSETGKPKTEETDLYLSQQPSQQPSQRTLIVRDPTKFSSPGGRSTHAIVSSPTESQLDAALPQVTDSETTYNRSLDDISTTNSVVSQEERQLENLRETSNRLSFISSSQRTFVTSTGSSPAASPTCDKFDKGTFSHHDEARGEVKSRPNAAEIITRRESRQVGIPFLEGGPGSNNTQAWPTAVKTMHNDNMALVAGIRPTPNFSVPHSSNRRFSYAQRPGSSADVSPARRQDHDGDVPSNAAASRMPMEAAHRLSVVTDLIVTQEITLPPLPTSPMSPTSPTSLRSPRSPQSPQSPTRRLRSASHGRPAKLQSDLAHDPIPELPPWHKSPRKPASTSALRQRAASPPPNPPALPALPKKRPHIASFLAPNGISLDELRGYQPSPMDVGDGSDNMGFRKGESSCVSKRASMGSILSLHSSYSYEVHDSAVCSSKSSGSSVTITQPSQHCSSHYSTATKTPRSVAALHRRSMPQIALNGPPLAPPPTRALPPIPPKFQVKT